MLPNAVSWLLFEDESHLDRTIRIAQSLRIAELRTSFSWADWERPGGPAWLDFALKKFAGAGMQLLPCLFYTPVDKARVPKYAGADPEPKTSYPPRRLQDYADFTEEMIGRYGKNFTWIQLWNEPNWDVYWSWKMDPDWSVFGDMVRPALKAAKNAGKKVVLGGLSPYDVDWVEAMFSYGVLQEADALGIHAFPGTWDAEKGGRRKGRPWRGLDAEVADVKVQLAAHGSNAEVWFTETGYATFGDTAEERRRRETGQISFFEEIAACAADRSYWYSLIDQAEHTPTDNELTAGFARDHKAYHFGVVRSDGTPKPLFEHWRKRVI